MTLSKTIAEALTKDLQTKIKYRLVEAAVMVMNEDDATVNHVNRIAYASQVLLGRANILQVSFAVVSNGTVSTKIENDENYDDDIAYVITTIYDAFADAEEGVTT